MAARSQSGEGTTLSSDAASVRSLDDAPLSQVHIAAIVVSALAFTFDLGEIAFGSALSGVFSAPPYAISADRLAWFLASPYLGAIIGPPLVGAFADKTGRRRAMVATLLLLSLTSLAGACSPGIGALSVARGLSGIALGAFPPLMITYLTDLLPARYRGRLIMVAVAIGYLGPPATVFLMRWLTPLAPLGLEAWRWVLVIGGAGAVCAAVLYLFLPEPPRWLLAVRRADAAAPAALRTREDRRRFALVSALSFLFPWATIAFPLLTGAILVQRGFNLSDTLLYVGVATFGPFVGSGLVSSVADRVERRTALVVCALGMIVAAIGFWLLDAPIWLMTTSVAFSLSAALYLPTVTVYTAELIPTVHRARTASRAWSVSRVAAALGPLLLLPLVRSGRFGVVFAVITGAMAVSVLLIALFGPRGMAGRPVD